MDYSDSFTSLSNEPHSANGSDNVPDSVTDSVVSSPISSDVPLAPNQPTDDFKRLSGSFNTSGLGLDSFESPDDVGGLPGNPQVNSSPDGSVSPPDGPSDETTVPSDGPPDGRNSGISEGNQVKIAQYLYSYI